MSISEVYRNLYPWRNLEQFVSQLKRTIAYKSEDGSLIALNKPFGVGIYTAQDKNTSKQNQDKILARIVGSPKYCLQDALKPLADELGSPKPFEVIKGIDRYVSGLVLVANDPARQKANFKRAVAASRINKWPPYGFRAVTSGYPTVTSDRIYEKVGVELIEIDELGDHREPVIAKQHTRRYLSKNEFKKTATFQAELEVKKVNRECSAALLELYVSKLAWDFPRCYISSKTSFVLGDVRFSKRIREVLGQKIQISALKASLDYDGGYEPLNPKLREVLGINKNASIPLMLDLHTIRLKHFHKNQENNDLVIKSQFMPAHFAVTANRLGLLDDQT